MATFPINLKLARPRQLPHSLSPVHPCSSLVEASMKRRSFSVTGGGSASSESGSHAHDTNDIGVPSRSASDHQRAFDLNLDAEIVQSQPAQADDHGGPAAGSPASPGHSLPPAVGAASFSSSESESGDSDMETDEEDDKYHSYLVPVPRRDALRVRYCHRYSAWFCPVCPGKKAGRWKNIADIKNHMKGLANSGRLKEDNPKKWSRHRVLARNEGWM